MRRRGSAIGLGREYGGEVRPRWVVWFLFVSLLSGLPASVICISSRPPFPHPFFLPPVVRLISRNRPDRLVPVQSHPIPSSAPVPFLFHLHLHHLHSYTNTILCLCVLLVLGICLCMGVCTCSETGEYFCMHVRLLLLHGYGANHLYSRKNSLASEPASRFPC